MNDEPKGDSGIGKFCFGLILTAVFLLLTVSLISHSPFDPPESLLFTGQPESEVRNLCGRAGAAVSALLFNFCGVGVWFLLLALFLRLISYFRASPCRAPILKTVGFFLMLAAVCGTVSCVTLPWEVGTVYGPGGWYGAMVRSALGDWFAPLGTAAFLMSLFLAGVVLACDWNFLRVLFVITGVYALSELITLPMKRKRAAKAPNAGGTEIQTPDQKPLPAEIKRALAERAANEATEPAVESVDEVDDSDVEEYEETDDYEEEGEDDENDEGDAAQETVEEKRPYVLPNINLLDSSQPCDYEHLERNVRETAKRLERVFASFNVNVHVTEMQTGPVLTLYEIELEQGTRLASIRSLSEDLAVKMKVPSVRIVAPIPGKNTVGVELPNTNRALVHLSEVLKEGKKDAEKMAIPVFLGKNVVGDPMVADLTKLPHLLIAGRTGTGKSVCLNSIILSILMTRTPDQARLLMIDPKRVELSPYKTVPHLIYPVVTDMKKAEAVLAWAVAKMEERYCHLERAGARQLSEYNRWTPQQLRVRMNPESEEEWAKIPKNMPYLIIIADEMSDMLAVAGKDVETHIIRLAQKSRAVGIHLVLATQKPTVDVITGQIKSNLPARIAFGVASVTDSRVVLDCKGAEKLLGNGDMLFLQPGTSQVIRGQGTFVSGDEVESVVAEISTDRPDFEQDLFLFGEEDARPDRMAELLRNKDKLYDETVEFVIQEGRASTSLLQRRFGIGYGRAARIIDTMAAEGVISPPGNNAMQPRDILMTLERWRELNDVQPDGTDAPISEPSDQPPRKTRFIPEKRVPFDEEKYEDAEEYGEEYDEEYDAEEYDGEEELEEAVEYDDEYSEEVEEDVDSYDEEADEGEGEDEGDVSGVEESTDVEETSDGEEFSDGEEVAAEEFIEDDSADEEIPPAPNLRDLAKQRRLKKKNKKKKKKKRR